MKNAKSTLLILGITATAAIILLVLRGLNTDQPPVRGSTAMTEFNEETVDTVASGQEPDVTAPDAAEDVTSGAPPADNPTTASNSNSDETALATASTAATQDAPQADEADRDSATEDDATAPSLSQRVFEVVTEVQARQLDGQWEEALNEMNALYLAFDELNPFEQATLLNFYTNTLLQLEMYQESISAFSRLLTIPELRPDVNARAILALGQLHNQVGEPDAAVSYYEQWLAFTAGMPEMEQQTRRVQQLLTQARAANERL